ADVDHHEGAERAAGEELGVEPGGVEADNRAGGQAGGAHADDEVGGLQRGVQPGGRDPPGLVGEGLGDHLGALREEPLPLQVEFAVEAEDRKSTRLNSSHVKISYAVFCLKKAASGRP